MNYLEGEGELVRLDEEIHLEPDSGAIGRAILDTRGPAIWAQNIYGYETTMTTGLMATQQRVAMAMGLPKEASMKEQKAAFLKAYDRYPVKPRMVKDAPCKENIVCGDDVNLFQFPIARNNINDAGPYIYKNCVITKDPDSDWVNMGVYRMQVVDCNKTSNLANPYRHWGEHFNKARQRGEPMEMAVALGTEPVFYMSAGSTIPSGWSEMDFAGALRQEPVELVMAETVNLPVPATAEIVLEGVVRPEPRVLEGPFGEGLGAYAGTFILPVFEVNAITYRNNPIFDTLYIGRPPTESSISALPGIIGSIEQVLKSRFPQIIEVACLYPKSNVVIQGKWNLADEPHRVMAALWSSRASSNDKVVTIVDEDINPWDAADVMWAIATRTQANNDLVIIPGNLADLDPAQNLDGLSCWLGIDATKTRPPHRHKVSLWVTPPEGTDAWKEKFKKLKKGDA
ncbi:UbiD family decarboxylase [Candidatus Omnitrophota bacterium]